MSSDENIVGGVAVPAIGEKYRSAASFITVTDDEADGNSRDQRIGTCR
ncbi:hypothetical protein OG563_35225 [Nocardia vinacea]|uniref:Uncharacterized protein n=1 Tax=Nocardia vinacea TaxID=96468 RepID=A0ABZ1YMC3_9NOCA|nr:hypothetical protein [Nocardia vinacea]